MMVKNKLSIFIFLFVISASDVLSHELHGNWTSIKMNGSPCAELIEKINYSFSPDGSYEVHSWMRRFGGVKEEEATGTYIITGDKVTAHVEGYTVGPYRYSFDNGELIVYENSPPCSIRLKRMTG